MTWSYSGNPGASDLDETRWHSGDTNTNDQLITNEEINWALTKYSDPKIAAALMLRGLAAQATRLVTNSVGGVSVNAAELAKAFQDRANELDVLGVTRGNAGLLPSFGGLTISEKLTYRDNTDAVQPNFNKGQDDIPGGPGNNVYADDLTRW